MKKFIIEYEIEAYGSIEVLAKSKDAAYEKYREHTWHDLIDIATLSEQYEIELAEDGKE
jgi:hypothetical protein